MARTYWVHISFYDLPDNYFKLAYTAEEIRQYYPSILTRSATSLVPILDEYIAANVEILNIYTLKEILDAYDLPDDNEFWFDRVSLYELIKLLGANTR